MNEAYDLHTKEVGRMCSTSLVLKARMRRLTCGRGDWTSMLIFPSIHMKNALKHVSTLATN